MYNNFGIINILKFFAPGAALGAKNIFFHRMTPKKKFYYILVNGLMAKDELPLQYLTFELMRPQHWPNYKSYRLVILWVNSAHIDLQHISSRGC